MAVGLRFLTALFSPPSRIIRHITLKQITKFPGQYLPHMLSTVIRRKEAVTKMITVRKKVLVGFESCKL